MISQVTILCTHLNSLLVLQVDLVSAAPLTSVGYENIWNIAVFNGDMKN